MNKCKYEIKIKDMHSDIIEIKKDIKNLLQFKWAILGVIGFISFAVTFAASFLSQ
jgi:hypothetical protein